MRDIIKKSTLVVILGLAATLAFSQTITRTIDGRNYLVHKVVSGETLYKLSKAYSVSVQEIKDANGGSESIKIGQELLIPSKETPSATFVAEPTEVASTSVHVVKSGETLSKIALKYGTTVNRLKELNNISNTDIKIGQKLNVPSGNAIEPAVVTEPAAVAEVVEPAVVEVKVEKPVSKPVSVNQPANPRNAGDTGSRINKGVVGGMPETADVVLAETATEKEETAMALVIDGGMDQSRTFVKHPTLPKGSIIVVINENTGKMAYCRVVENAKYDELDGSGLVITKAVAEKIGLKVSPSTVKIRYATP